MCDDFTREQEDAALARMESMRGISRRQFAALGGAAAIAACAPAEGEALTIADAGMVEKTVNFETADGTADAFFVHPGSGTFPAVILWPDIAGLREAYHMMAKRLAGAGFAVLAINQYYRSAKAPVLGSFMEWRTEEGRAKLAPMIEQLGPDPVMRDAKAAVAFLDAQAAVDTSMGIGSCGYCMGGPFTVFTAAAVPERVKAAASFHGGGLVRDNAQSPHKLLDQTKAHYLFAIAQNDDARSPDDKQVLKDAATAAGVMAEVEVYAADHGWCTLDSPVYDKGEAERAWGRMLKLYEDAL
ncbi:dienelactone hydrolase family protein [Pontixanthobacter gangjinensis]|uniref:Dienelactone hydrolase family protein n=1 Tax=Pontixanthobacter gangjinensis TaxID=1028742 RepID=A0A6I4SJT4_9SPHN|nr:dienelactone hydrolase family protein [Pontixanthobacter gangjinensis]MXO55390.1 dienelactone hydrolase family protein [Pontixanthobacter gangjinensis]